MFIKNLGEENMNKKLLAGALSILFAVSGLTGKAMLPIDNKSEVYFKSNFECLLESFKKSLFKFYENRLFKSYIECLKEFYAAKENLEKGNGKSNRELAKKYLNALEKLERIKAEYEAILQNREAIIGSIQVHDRF